MFKHLLLATDGSAHAESAIRTGVQLAASLGARVTGITVVARGEVPPPTRHQAGETADDVPHAHLRFFSVVANTHAVPYDTACIPDDEPYAAIIRTAEQRGCDLIVMGAFGHTGLKGELLGSQTQKVLAHGHVPVLVCR